MVGNDMPYHMAHMPMAHMPRYTVSYAIFFYGICSKPTYHSNRGYFSKSFFALMWEPLVGVETRNRNSKILRSHFLH